MEVAAENKVLSFVSGWERPAEENAVRKEALQALNAMEFPTTRVEDWKYTRVGKITKRSFKQWNTAVDISPYIIEGLDAHQLVFVNGYYREDLSAIKNDDALTIHAVDNLDDEYYGKMVEDVDENVFSLMNKAYSNGGVFLHVAKQMKAQHPIHMIHVLTGDEVVANPRHFIRVEQGAKAEVVTTFQSEKAEQSFSNVVMEGHLEANAHLRIHKVQTEAKDCFHIANELFVQDEGSEFLINTVTTGSRLTRNGLNVIVEGENCHTEMNGAYLGTERQHLDNHTLIDQLYSNCTSSETYKGVMDDKSVGVFNGKVIVRQDAQKIEAYQSNGNILLSKEATVNSKPELEIYADDVRCSHGSTTGQLDEDALFYLRTRGISEKNARNLLVAAFIGDVLEKIDVKPLRKAVDEHFLNEFGWEF
ncbi:MAG: Fe-S cluster assembly protein SufD [Bacteroidota bacterium]